MSRTYILPAGSPIEALENLLQGKTPRGLLEVKPIYTYVASDGANVNIDVERLWTWIKAQQPPLEIWSTRVSLQFAQKLHTENTVSPQRLCELSDRPECLKDPLIYCKSGTKTNGVPDVMLVDGHHRYVLHAILGLDQAPGWVLEETQWRPFQLTGLPEITAQELIALPITKRHY